MGKWHFTLYGSDTDESTETPLKSAILAHADVKSWTFKALGGFPAPELIDDSNEYLNNFISGKSVIRMGYKPKAFPVAYPNSITALEDFFALDVLGKTYKWIEFGSDYYLQPKALVDAGFTTGQKLLAVALMSVSVTDGNYGKEIELELSLRTV